VDRVPVIGLEAHAVIGIRAADYDPVLIGFDDYLVAVVHVPFEDFLIVVGVEHVDIAGLVGGVADASAAGVLHRGVAGDRGPPVAADPGGHHQSDNGGHHQITHD